MITLVHEDIFIYIDKVESVTQSLSGASDFSLTNNSTGSIVDYGSIEINVNSGSYTGLTMSNGVDNITINKPLTAGDTMVLDLRDKHYTLNGSVFFLDDYLTLEDDANNTISLSFVGTGELEVNYTRNQCVTNDNDLMFCSSLSHNDNSDIITKTNVKGQVKYLKSAKKSYSWDISVLCNDTELEKFESSSGYLRFRLVDEEGMDLGKLSNCVVASIQKSSSDGGDYTCSLSGSFEKIFN